MNYYEILEITSTASDEVIRMAYKALAKKYHPDTYEGDKAYTAPQTTESELAGDKTNTSQSENTTDTEEDDQSKEKPAVPFVGVAAMIVALIGVVIIDIKYRKKKYGE